MHGLAALQPHICDVIRWQNRASFWPPQSIQRLCSNSGRSVSSLVTHTRLLFTAFVAHSMTSANILVSICTWYVLSSSWNAHAWTVPADRVCRIVTTYRWLTWHLCSDLIQQTSELDLMYELQKAQFSSLSSSWYLQQISSLSRRSLYTTVTSIATLAQPIPPSSPFELSCL